MRVHHRLCSLKAANILYEIDLSLKSILNESFGYFKSLRHNFSSDKNEISTVPYGFSASRILSAKGPYPKAEKSVLRRI